MKMSDKSNSRTKALTVRVQTTVLRHLMRVRKFKTQSELINTLLAEEAERTRAEAILRATTGTLTASDFDARLL